MNPAEMCTDARIIEAYLGRGSGAGQNEEVAAMSLLTLTDIHSYYDHIYLKGISLTVEQGEIVSLIGSNGAGKSTTLLAVSGMEPYTIGLSGLGYVFKGHGIPPRLTVRGNLEMRAFTVRDSVAVREWR